MEAVKWAANKLGFFFSFSLRDFITKPVQVKYIFTLLIPDGNGCLDTVLVLLWPL
jgi:hypothetical protein